MSGETEKFVSGWTTDTLKELVDAKLEALEADLRSANLVANERDVRYSQRFNAQQEALTAALSAAKEAVAAALLAADRAVTKAELASEKRFESVNEFRAALSDQSTTLMTRNEYNAAHQSVVDKIDRLEKWQASASGSSAGLSGAWQVFLGIIGIVGSLAAVVYTVHAITGH